MNPPVPPTARQTNRDLRGSCVADVRVALLAAGQHHVIGHHEAGSCGLSDDQIAYRLVTGRWFHVFVGVYAVGAPATTFLARSKGATLAVAESALADGSGAALLGFNRSAPVRPHVLVERRGGRVREGIVVHSTCRLDARDVSEVEGIPVLTAPRCLLDRAAKLSARRLDGELREARARGLASDDALRDVIARHPGRRGGRALATALLGPFTRSELELRFLEVIAGLPAPEVNAIVAGDEVDFLWRDAAVAVELDGRATHGVTAAIARDAAKDARLRALGLRVERLTWWDVVRDGRRTADALETALRDRRTAMVAVRLSSAGLSGGAA